ncbi:MAG: hypothetical protein L0Y70_22385 [Gemmataceae bacterium]|nr:hypothetical protein [Gemmataceae bacterium]
MGRKRRIEAYAIVVSICIFAVNWQSARADTLDDIFNQLEKRRAETKTVYYKMSGTKYRTKDADAEAGGKAPEHTSPIELLFKLDFTKGWVARRHKFEALNIGTLKYESAGRSTFYDGSVAKIYKQYDPAIKPSLSERNADIYVKKLTKGQQVDWLQDDDMPIFLYHGYLVSAKNPDFHIQKIACADQSSFQLVGTAKVGDTDCHVVRDTLQQRGDSFEYAISQGNDFLVLRMDRLHDGNLRARTSIKPKKQGRAWIPESWETVMLGPGGRLLESSAKYKVDEVVLNEVYPIEDFQGDKIQPGNIISDADKKAYFQADSQGALNPIIPDAPRSSPVVFYVIVTVLLLSLIVGTVAWIRRKHSVVHSTK